MAYPTRTPSQVPLFPVKAAPGSISPAKSGVFPGKPGPGVIFPGKPTPGGIFPGSGGSPGYNPDPPYGDRRRRHEYRELRRDGYLGVGYPLEWLWLVDMEATVEAEEVGLLEPPLIDLWP
jgi:hypothetical protein